MAGLDGRDYNAGELADLIAAKDAEIDGVSAQAESIMQAWESADAESAAEWRSAFEAMQQRYQSARSAGQAYISYVKLITVDTIWNDEDATDRYDAILTAESPAWPGQWANGDGSLNDLEARLSAAYASLGQTQPALPPIPQPNPNNDSGLNPRSWEGYVTGLAYKAGFVPASEIPPGTPGGPDGTPFVPSNKTWIEYAGLAAVVVGGYEAIKHRVWRFFI